MMKMVMRVIIKALLVLCLLLPAKTHHKHSLVSLKQAQCLAVALYHEARGEPLRGIAAVAAVVLNRASKHNMDVCKVISMPKQFSWYKHKPNMLPVSVLGPLLYDAHLYLEAYKRGTFVDNTFGATHFATKGTHNYWTKKFRKTITINNHAFYKER